MEDTSSKQTTMERIDSFMTYNHLAIAGVSRDSKKFGYLLFDSLSKQDKKTFYPVNPNIDPVIHKGWFPDVMCLPEFINHLLIVTPPEATNYVMETAIEKQIENVWIQQRSETDKAIKMALDNGINLIHGYCFLMFSKPVKGFHYIHRTINEILGKCPK